MVEALLAKLALHHNGYYNYTFQDFHLCYLILSYLISPCKELCDFYAIANLKCNTDNKISVAGGLVVSIVRTLFIRDTGIVILSFYN